MGLPAGYARNSAGWIFEIATGYGPYSSDITNDLILLGKTVIPQAGKSFVKGPADLWFEVSDNSGPYARNAAVVYTFLG